MGSMHVRVALVFLLLVAGVASAKGFRVVDLAGTPREIGRAHGRQLGAEARALYASYIVPLAKAAGGEAVLIAQARRHFVPNLPPAMREEMEGLAETAGLTFDQVLLANTFSDLLKRARTGGIGGCTVLGARADEPIVGRNLDYHEAKRLDGHTVVFNVAPAGKHRFTSVAFPMLVGVYSGMNEHGLTAAVLEVYGEKHRPPAPNVLPTSLVYRRVLEEGRTVEDAEKLLGPILTFQHLLLADPRSMIVMRLEQDVARREARHGERVFAINHFAENPGFARDRRAALAGADLRDADAVRAALRRAALGDLNAHAIVFYPRRRAFELAVGPPPAAANAFETYALPFRQ